MDVLANINWEVVLLTVDLLGTNCDFRSYSNLSSSISQRQPVNWVIGNW